MSDPKTTTPVELADKFLDNFVTGNTKSTERKWLVEQIREFGKQNLWGHAMKTDTTPFNLMTRVEKLEMLKDMRDYRKVLDGDSGDARLLSWAIWEIEKLHMVKASLGAVNA